MAQQSDALQTGQTAATQPRIHSMRVVQDISQPDVYRLYNARGWPIGTRITAHDFASPSQARTAAARMAYADQLAGAARLADMDYERTGTVSRETIDLIRRLLSDVAAA